MGVLLRFKKDFFEYFCGKSSPITRLVYLSTSSKLYYSPEFVRFTLRGAVPHNTIIWKTVASLGHRFLNFGRVESDAGQSPPYPLIFGSDPRWNCSEGVTSHFNLSQFTNLKKMNIKIQNVEIYGFDKLLCLEELKVDFQASSPDLILSQLVNLQYLASLNIVVNCYYMDTLSDILFQMAGLGHLSIENNGECSDLELKQAPSLTELKLKNWVVDIADYQWVKKLNVNSCELSLVVPRGIEEFRILNEIIPGTLERLIEIGTGTLKILGAYHCFVSVNAFGRYPKLKWIDLRCCTFKLKNYSIMNKYFRSRKVIITSGI